VTPTRSSHAPSPPSRDPIACGIVTPLSPAMPRRTENAADTELARKNTNVTITPAKVSTKPTGAMIKSWLFW
jgi:hypothetical protein